MGAREEGVPKVSMKTMLCTCTRPGSGGCRAIWLQRVIPESERDKDSDKRIMATAKKTLLAAKRRGGGRDTKRRGLQEREGDVNGGNNSETRIRNATENADEEEETARPAQYTCSCGQ